MFSSHTHKKKDCSFKGQDEVLANHLEKIAQLCENSLMNRLPGLEMAVGADFSSTNLGFRSW